MAQLTVLGVSYKTASLCVREKLTFDLPAMLSCSRALVASGLVQAIAIVSTCHRTEFYCDGLSDTCVGHFWHWLQEYRQFPSREVLGEAVYQYTDVLAVRHLLRVSAGLDSLILGETQILGQMKSAYDQARVAGTLGKNLTRLFQFAFGVAKKVRTETLIGANSLSVACIATRLVKAILFDKERLKILFIGSGNMIQLAARRFQRLGMNKPIFANRTEKKVMPLVKKFQGELIALSAVTKRLSEVDVLVTATASPIPLLYKAGVEKAQIDRAHRPLLLIDLAVPRDIDPTVGTVPNVYLYTVDDLQEMAIDNRQTREQAAIDAEAMVNQKAQAFMGWLRAQSKVERIRQYRESCAIIKENSIQEALIALTQGKAPAVVVQHLAHRLTNRLMHEPTLVLRRLVFNEKKTRVGRKTQSYESIYS